MPPKKEAKKAADPKAAEGGDPGELVGTLLINYTKFCKCVQGERLGALAPLPRMRVPRLCVPHVNLSAYAILCPPIDSTRRNVGIVANQKVIFQLTNEEALEVFEKTKQVRAGYE